MKNNNLIILDEVDKPVAVISLKNPLNKNFEEVLCTLKENKKFIQLFMQAVKDDFADDDAKYSLGNIEYYSMDCFTKIIVYQSYPKEEAIEYSFYIYPVSIYQ